MEMIQTPIDLSKDWNARENHRYQDESLISVSDNDTQKIVDKICRHFKLGKYNLRFRGENGGATIWTFSKHIRFSHNPSFVLICHELCHALCRRRYENSKIRHGCKKWETQMKRLIGYCKAKNFWKEEIEKWSIPKPTKPEPTKDELRTLKIEKAKSNIVRYEKKIKMYQRKISKAKRSISMLERFKKR